MERPNIEDQMNEIIGSAPMEINIDITEHNPEPVRKEQTKPKETEKKTPKEPEAEPVKVKGKIVKRINRNTLQRMVDNKIDRLIREYETPAGGYLLIRASTGECIEIKGVITVGKETACDFVIDNNPTISRYHAQLELRGNRLIAKDTSLNGTYANGKKLIKNQETEIGEGNIIFSNEKFQIKKND